jgi:hypothetical protein
MRYINNMKEQTRLILDVNQQDHPAGRHQTSIKMRSYYEH